MVADFLRLQTSSPGVPRARRKNPGHQEDANEFWRTQTFPKLPWFWRCGLKTAENDDSFWELRIRGKGKSEDSAGACFAPFFFAGDFLDDISLFVIIIVLFVLYVIVALGLRIVL